MTMPAWYIATGVNAPWPVTSPTPQTLSVGPAAVVDRQRPGVTSTPTVSAPVAARSTRRPPAAGSPGTGQDVARAHPDPKPAASEIAGYVAFWRGVRVEAG